MCREQLAASGKWGDVVWAADAAGKMPGREYFQELSDEDAAKIQALFERFAEHGRINNRQQFKKLENRQSLAILEFKRGQHRFLGTFGPGTSFLIAHGLKKKQDKHKPADLDRAVRILKEHLTRQEKGGSR